MGMEVNPEQLAMIMPADQLHTTDRVSDTELEDGRGRSLGNYRDRKTLETKEDMWNRKYWAAKNTGLLQRIEAHGVQEPVALNVDDRPEVDKNIRDGYHRVASAHAVDPKMEVPVVHKTIRESHDYRQR